MSATKILIADDDSAIRRLVCHNIIKAGYEVVEAVDGRDALDKMSPDIGMILLDLSMPKMGGLECLKELKAKYPCTQVIMISASGNLDNVVEAMHQGAFWYVSKPFDPREIIQLLGRASALFDSEKEREELKSLITTSGKSSKIISKSKVMIEVLDKIDKMATLPSPVLLTGESGTGKSSLARYIHNHGDRKDGPFVTFNCAAVPKDLIEGELFGHEKGAFTGATTARPGCIELANEGTLFLDEIGDMPLDLQPKLLSVLQEKTIRRLGASKSKKINFRLISATHQDLQDLCEEKVFREDLFYRINVLAVEIPALRNRREDITPLCQSILLRIAEQHKLSKPPTIKKEAMNKLLEHQWPGNVRELENVLERAVVYSDGLNIEAENLVFSTLKRKQKALNLAGMKMEEIEELALRQTLESCGGVRSKAAKMLGLAEKTVYNKLTKYGYKE